MEEEGAVFFSPPSFRQTGHSRPFAELAYILCFESKTLYASAVTQMLLEKANQITSRKMPGWQSG